jgi:hypothetical protein
MSGPGSADRFSAASIVIVGMAACSAGVASIITESPIAVTGPLSAGAGAVVVVVVVGGMVDVEVVFALASVVGDGATRGERSSESHPNATRTKSTTTAPPVRDTYFFTFRIRRISAALLLRFARS